MFFTVYEWHTGEEGWYVYKQPDNKAVRAIRYDGPLKREEAEESVRVRNFSNQ